MTYLFNASFPTRNIAYGIATNNSPGTPLDCIILHKRVFENFILADEPFVKALQIFEICVSVNNNFCGKLVSSLEFPNKYYGRFKSYFISFFIAYFNLLSWELGNFTHVILSQFITIFY